MIKDAAEFVALRQSEKIEEYSRAATDEAGLDTWLEVIERHPEMRVWVAHNKSIPLKILEILARDPDFTVREAVARKNKLSCEVFLLLSKDPDRSVRERVACNKKVPREALEILAIDEDDGVARYAQESLLRKGHCFEGQPGCSVEQ